MTPEERARRLTDCIENSDQYAGFDLFGTIISAMADQDRESREDENGKPCKYLQKVETESGYLYRCTKYIDSL